jgi:hypothetical protein
MGAVRVVSKYVRGGSGCESRGNVLGVGWQNWEGSGIENRRQRTSQTFESSLAGPRSPPLRGGDVASKDDSTSRVPVVASSRIFSLILKVLFLPFSKNLRFL